MGKRSNGKKKQRTTADVKQIGSCKKFQPDTLTKRLESRQANQKHKRQNGFSQVRSIADLVSNVASRQESFETVQQETQKEGLEVKQGIKRSFYKEFRKVVDEADVVLQVLDARDPEGCRCQDAETAVLSNYSKRLILILNKIDLVPPDIALSWKKHLSKQFPTVLFKANTQTQRAHLKQANTDVKGSSFKMLSTSACLGAKELMKLLNNYTRNKGIRTSIRVGVIGLPNVGKSSLINSLKRNRSCCVGATPGVTRNIQEVELDSKIKLIDSPGVVLSTSVGPLAAIQNSVKLDSLEDPLKPIQLIIEYCGAEQIADHYKIASFTSAQDLAALLAFKYGKLHSGGTPDRVSAAKVLLKDWSHGSVQFYTTPPKQNQENIASSASVVSEWAAEFNLTEDAIRVEDQDDAVEGGMRDLPPELSVVFKPEKEKKEEEVDKLFDKPYEVPHLQNSKVIKSKKKAVKRDRKKMSQFADMFDNALNTMMDCDYEEGQGMSDASDQ